MKYAAVVVLAVVALALVGCADQSSLNNPVSTQATISTPGSSSQQTGVIKTEQQVFAAGSGQEFVVVGTIDYKYETKQTGTEFSYKAVANIRVVRVNNPDESYPVVETFSQSGLVAAGALPDVVSVVGMDNGYLSLHFSVQDGFSLEDISLSEGLVSASAYNSTK